MDIAQLKLDLVQRLLANSDVSFLEKLRALLLRKEQGESIRDQEMADMMAAANTFAVTAYSEDEPDISGIKLQEPKPPAKAKRELTAIIEREGDGYVALCPELDVASQGDTIEEARANLIEALELFFESASTEELRERLHEEVLVTRVQVVV